MVVKVDSVLPEELKPLLAFAIYKISSRGRPAGRENSAGFFEIRSTEAYTKSRTG